MRGEIAWRDGIFGYLKLIIYIYIYIYIFFFFLVKLIYSFLAIYSFLFRADLPHTQKYDIKDIYDLLVRPHHIKDFFFFFLREGVRSNNSSLSSGQNIN